ncbi:hypothetical protein RRG08_041298 [Elysia crispata]|uniref:Uncharacterized protein n=1 Tax=Elysia crispata TaxID=231223 RepID=A0AAE1DMN6_9GAST|nr:hypothetical protein RRG08_041298 [Elysia crispata]
MVLERVKPCHLCIVCWDTIKHKLVVEDIHPAQYLNAYRALFFFFERMRNRNTVESIRHIVKNMNVMRRYLFFNTTLPTEELELLTSLLMEVVAVVFHRNPKVKFSEENTAEDNICVSVVETSLWPA